MTGIGLVLIGLVAGGFAAALGIGGGVIFVPALVVFFGFEQPLAQGTSLAVILPTAVVGALAHHRRGRVDWGLALWASIGGAIGAIGGAAIALGIAPSLLRRMFALLLLAVLARMLAGDPMWRRRP